MNYYPLWKIIYLIFQWNQPKLFLHLIKNKNLTLKYRPLKLKNDKNNKVIKIKWFLLLLTLDDRHNPYVAQTQWKWIFFFFFTENILRFWLDTDDCSNGNKSQHWTNPLSNLRAISPKMSILHCFSNRCQGSFPKRIFGDSKRHVEIKLYYGSCEV